LPGHKYYVRKGDLYLHLAIDSGGMTPFWVKDKEQASPFADMLDTQKFIRERLTDRYPNEAGVWVSVSA
jgi:hypothetical protein